MPTPAKLLELVRRFRDQRASYTSGRYKEAQLRKEFVDPFIRLLDWDVDNERGYAEPYKEVIHEDSLKTASGTKAPGLRPPNRRSAQVFDRGQRTFGQSQG